MGLGVVKVGLDDLNVGLGDFGLFKTILKLSSQLNLSEVRSIVCLVEATGHVEWMGRLMKRRRRFRHRPA